jgi:alkylated DNA repair dioxygenase AlkB
MQGELFAEAEAACSIAGLLYERNFLSVDEEASLVEVIGSLPLQAAKYKEYVARRRVTSYGGSYDFDTNTLLPAVELDERLIPLRNRVACWLGVKGEALVHALVAEYAEGTPLGWHRDVPDFEWIAGVSLGSAARLRLRPFPPDAAARRHVSEFELAPRSIYSLQGAARWEWQHSVPPVKSLRWSITFRTRRASAETTSAPR